MRLDKYLSNNTTYSRTDIKKIIKAGRITVNEVVEKSTSFAISADDLIKLDGNAVEVFTDMYIVFYKPAGIVCATTDAEHPTVIDALKQSAEDENDTKLLDALYNEKIQIVGRLDKDTTGLLLLTSDGHWNHKVTSPKSKCPKTYRVSLEEDITEAQIAELETGVLLKNESKPTLPATVEKITNTEILLTIQEGKYHQVKRMLAAVGNKVIALHRTAIGRLTLPNELQETEYFYLDNSERDTFCENE
ncbi:pseudouridine synthase [Sessilibacter sp. MAH4]